MVYSSTLIRDFWTCPNLKNQVLLPLLFYDNKVYQYKNDKLVKSVTKMDKVVKELNKVVKELNKVEKNYSLIFSNSRELLEP